MEMVFLLEHNGQRGVGSHIRPHQNGAEQQHNARVCWPRSRRRGARRAGTRPQSNAMGMVANTVNVPQALSYLALTTAMKPGQGQDENKQNGPGVQCL